MLLQIIIVSERSLTYHNKAIHSPDGLNFLRSSKLYKMNTQMEKWITLYTKCVFLTFLTNTVV